MRGEDVAEVDTAGGARVVLEVRERGGPGYRGAVLARIPADDPDAAPCETWEDVAHVLEVLEDRAAVVEIRDRWTGAGYPVGARDPLEDLAAVVEAAHPCEDPGCEIRGMIRGGWALVALEALGSAGALEEGAWYVALEMHRGYLESAAGRDREALEREEWREWWEAHHVPEACARCGSVQYLEDETLRDVAALLEPEALEDLEEWHDRDRAEVLEALEALAAAHPCTACREVLTWPRLEEVRREHPRRLYPGETCRGEMVPHVAPFTGTPSHRCETCGYVALLEPEEAP